MPLHAGKKLSVHVGFVLLLCLCLVVQPRSAAGQKAGRLTDQETEVIKQEVQTIDEATELYRQGNFQQAIPKAKRAFEMAQVLVGTNHVLTVTTCNLLGLVYNSAGQYAEAAALYQRALAILERLPGTNDLLAAAVANNLAAVHLMRGEYLKAEPLSQRSLGITEKHFGPDSIESVTNLNNLAFLYDRMGRYAQAELLYQRVRKLAEKNAGPEDPLLLTALGNLGIHHYYTGNYAEAEKLFQRVLNAREKQNPKHPDTATTLNDLGSLYSTIGDNANACLFLGRALEIRLGCLGSAHPQTMVTLNALAVTEDRMGRQTNAFKYYAHVINSFIATGRTNDPAVVDVVNNVATLYLKNGDYTNALVCLMLALRVATNSMSREQPQFTRLTQNMGIALVGLGDFAGAERCLAGTWQILRKTLGPEHPNTAGTLESLVFVYLDRGKRSMALEGARQAQQLELNTFSNLLSFASERQRLTYQPTVPEFSALATLGCAPELGLEVLRRKGAVLDSVLEDRLAARATGNPALAETIEELRLTKQRLTQLLFELPKHKATNESSRQWNWNEVGKTSREADRLEGILAQHVTGLGHARSALKVTGSQVQQAMPGGSILVEFIRYGHYLGTNKFERRYGAIVISTHGEPKWVPLRAASRIEDDIGGYLAAVRGYSSEADLKEILLKLHREIWLPIEAVLPAGCKTVIISPDGQLNFLSFATFLNARGQFLAEDYSIRYVASGRDLLRKFKPATASNMVIYARPDYLSGATSPAAELTPASYTLGAPEKRELQDLKLIDLPGTSRESAALAERARAWGWPVIVREKANATEANLRADRSPYILHLATHGFFLPETRTDGINYSIHGIGGTPSISSLILGADPPSLKPILLVDPMIRSGLALAGAQATLNSWGRGGIPPPDNDGVLTAEEVGGLRLEGTWLVTLSACDTGKGQALAGEGVLGLRRGFIEAGAQNLLMTLWSVADEDGSRIIVDFYEAAHKSGNPPSALAAVQRDWLVKLRKEHSLAKAVQIAGPFIMSSQGPVK